MIFPKNEFNKISCKEAFVNKQCLIDMFDKIEKDKINIHQMMLLHNGSKVFSVNAEGFHQKKENVYSVSKSFTSVAIGILIDRKLLKLDDYVLFYFADELKRYKKEYEKLKVRHLLTMTVGQKQDRFIGLTPQHNPIEIFFNTEMVDEPGEKFLYSNYASYMLSAIVTKLTNKTLNDFLKEELYDVIGLENIFWPEFKGYTLGATGLRLNVSDMAKFGLLLLNDGKWEDKQIVSKAYLDEASSVQVDTSKEEKALNRYGYGFQFWINKFGDYKADGLYNQVIIINKKYNIVFAMTAYDDRNLTELFLDYVLKGFEKGWKVTSKSLRDSLKTFKNNSIAIIQEEEIKRKD
ncbi:MAG: beta-lactamase family protein [Candidatus Izimaplasma sp.]|nr:beta-lactamase family protein [Candidatus Izimaplasma bacterium]